MRRWKWQDKIGGSKQLATEIILPQFQGTSSFFERKKPL